MDATIARADGHTYRARYALSESCSRTVVAGENWLPLNDLRFVDAQQCGSGAAISMSILIPPLVNAPGTYKQPPPPGMTPFPLTWLLSNAGFDDSGSYAPVAGQATITISTIERRPGGRVRGMATAAVAHSGTGAKATATLSFDVLLK
jgi:hypothetical protein